MSNGGHDLNRHHRVSRARQAQAAARAVFGARGSTGTVLVVALLAIVAIAAIGAAAGWFGGKSRPAADASAATATQSRTATSQATETSTTPAAATLQTFSSSVLPFTFRYPSDWTAPACGSSCDAQLAPGAEAPSGSGGIEIARVSPQTESTCLRFTQVTPAETHEMHSGMSMTVVAWTNNSDLASGCTGAGEVGRYYGFTLDGNRSIECSVPTAAARAACNDVIDSIKPSAT